MIYIVGSGPAGTAAAVALVNKGKKVTVIDAGFQLEAERIEIVNNLSTLPKDQWNSDALKTIKENMKPHSEGVDIKYVYGSDYPYRGMNKYQTTKLINSKMVRSLARGGLSNVWGASILPYTDSDIEDWPIKYKDLEPHYKNILNFIPQAGAKDDLLSLFPILDDFQKYKLCNQASEFLQDMHSNKDILNKNGFRFGQARLAVNFNNNEIKNKCNYCGLCLYGCPYSLIYSTQDTLDKLKENNNFNYINGLLVEKVIESKDGVRILASSLKEEKDIELRGDLVLLAAGTVSSTRLLLNSLEAVNKKVYFKHSDHFQIPLIRYKYTQDYSSEEKHTLSQLFLELLDSSISDKTIHMQIYAHNDLFDKVIAEKLNIFEPFLKLPVDSFLGRLLIIKGYLHSDISSQIEATLSMENKGTLKLKGNKNLDAHKTLKKIRKKLNENRKNLKAMPFPLATKLSLPGTGNHSGGTFPMKDKPANFETDIIGIPYGLNKVHVVDSTIFPSIPATTILFSIMANAYRIASEL